MSALVLLYKCYRNSTVELDPSLMLALSSPFLSIFCYFNYKLIIFASQMVCNIVNCIKHIRKVGFGMSQPHAIPRPLVWLNQWTILLSVMLTWVAWILAIPLVANLLGVLWILVTCLNGWSISLRGWLL